MQSLYSTDCDILPILYLVELVFVPDVGICQISSNREYFPVRSRKTKNLYLEIYSNESKCQILCKLNVRDPLNFNKLNLGDVQKTDIPADMRPAFFPRVLEEMSRDVDPLK